MEQREAMSNLNDSHYTNGNTNHWMMNGFALACVKQWKDINQDKGDV